jgi:hypothetical protein
VAHLILLDALSDKIQVIIDKFNGL